MNQSTNMDEIDFNSIKLNNSNNLSQNSVDDSVKTDQNTDQKSDQPALKRELSEERINFMRVINTFNSYGDISRQKLNEKLKYFNSLPKNHQSFMQEYKESLLFQLKLVSVNEEVIRKIAVDIDIFENDTIDEDEKELLKSQCPDFSPEKHYHDKIPSILKQIVREWSVEGEEERKASFGPILNEIDKLFSGYKASEIKILVPGAGLGRLAFEIARRGYYCQGNEYSLFMLFSSNFILNKAPHASQYTIYPYLHTAVNNYSVYDQVRSVTFPDINISTVNVHNGFSMVGGNFVEIYDKPNQWDCVSTCFFIDTTHNVLDYVEKIYQILKPNGFWINAGPLLWHYADTHAESIEPSYDILKKAIKSFGFEFLTEQTNLPMHYTQNTNSMLVYKYNAVFFVCQKKFF